MNPWAAGIIKSVIDGVPMRQIPQKHTFNSILCISPQGTARRRYWNSIPKKWSWSEQPSQYVTDEEGRLGFNLEDGFRTVEFCIASAWLLRAPNSCPRVKMELGKPPDVKWIDWHEPEDPTEMHLEGEIFKPVRFKVGAIDVSTDAFEISNKGRLKHVASGGVTKGLYFADSRWAAINGVLVDILVAGKLKRPVIDLPPRIMLAAECLWSGNTPDDLADEEGIALETAWSYCWKAAQHFSKTDLLSLGPRLVSSDLWKLLKTIRDNRDPLFDADLTTLKNTADNELECGEYESSDVPFAEIRFARLCLSK